MTTLRCFAWTTLLLFALPGPSGCPGKRHCAPETPPTEEAPPEPPLATGAVIYAISHLIVPIGGRLAMEGSGFLDLTHLTIGGQEQPFVEIVDDGRVRIRPLVAGTPLGMQDIVVETAAGASTPYAVEVVEVGITPQWFSHGSVPRLNLTGLTAPIVVIEVQLGGVRVTASPIGDGLFELGPIPDDVPVGDQDLVLTTDGVPHGPLPVPVLHLVINEVDVCQTSSDDGEFIEISTGKADVDLDGYVLVLFNGSNDKAYRTIDLTGTLVGLTNANGLLVIGNESVVGASALGRLLPTSAIQNGPDAIALYQGIASDFPSGAIVTSDRLIDALLYDTSDTDDIELLEVLLGSGAGAVQVDEGAGGDAQLDSIARLSPERLDGRAFGPRTPTPGAPNLAR